MYELATQLRESGNILIPSPSITPLPSYPSHSSGITSSPPSSSSSSGKISPAVLLIIVILAVIFFVSGVLHLLVRFLMKRPSFYSSDYQSNRHPNNSNTRNVSVNTNSSSEALQRQLQQLFRLHDSGLDQALIDALPVFFYKDIVNSKEPFDCPVCLCEFSDQDKLRLLPLCSHAFHVSCIDTWLLSNSTCPLCRGSLLGAGLEGQEFSLDYWRELSFGRSIDCDYSHINNNNQNGHSFNRSYKPTIMEENASERRVFSVRLGKYKSVNDGNEATTEHENCGTSATASSSSQLDARRCYSLGTYQYVLAESNLQVALSTDVGNSNADLGGSRKHEKMMEQNGNLMVDGDVEGKKISRRNRGDSFSVSKIWLWSKKGKFLGSSETNVDNHAGPPPLNVVLPLSNRDDVP